MQVTLSNAADILAVFPQLSSNVDEIAREYDYSTHQYVELQNRVIIKKCECPISVSKIILIIVSSGQDTSKRVYSKELLLQGCFFYCVLGFLELTPSLGRTSTSAMQL